MISPLQAWLASWTRLAPRFRVPGTKLKVRPRTNASSLRLLLSWRRDWKTTAIGKILENRPGTFIDVGANAGQTLVDFFLAPVKGAYVGFEPNIACHQHLAEMVRFNGLENCRIVPAGLGDRTRIAPLYLFGGDSDPGASIDRQLRPDLDATPVTVALYRFDELQEFRSGDIALVKIDVEGGELEVLRGMEGTIREKQPWVICEVLDCDSAADRGRHAARSAELMRFLREMDYCVYRFIRDSSGSDLRGLEAVDRFPQKEWDESSAAACDYLFVPSGERKRAEALVVARPRSR